MEIEMFIHEKEEIKSMNFDGISIIDCSPAKLTTICSEALKRFDDYQQIAGDQGKNEVLNYFVNCYDEMEEVFFHLKEGGLLSLSTRNEIRMLIKCAEKCAASELYM